MNRSTKVFKGFIQVLFLTALMLTGCNGGGGSNPTPVDPGPTNPVTPPGTTNPPPVIPPIAGSPQQDPKLALSNIRISGGPTANAGECTAIGVDSQGTVHIVYYSDSEGSPKHAFCQKANDCSDLSNWTVEFIEDNRTRSPKLGRDINLAIDSNDQLHVSYRDVLDSLTNYPKTTADGVAVLKYASGKKIGGSWTWTPMLVEDTIYGVTDTYIDLSSDKIHISYHKKAAPSDLTSDVLSYASCVIPCTSWTPTQVDQGKETGVPNHIVVANGSVHISYYSDGKLKYAVCDLSGNCTSGSSWHLKTIDEGTFELGRDNSLAVRADGSVHVTYFDSGNGNDNGTGIDSSDHPYLKYASCPSDCAGSGVWKSTPVDGFDNVADSSDNRVNIGRSSQVKLSPDGRLHVTYREMDISHQDLKYATCLLTTDCLSANNWKHYWVDGNGVGWDTYLAFASDGSIHISYRDSTNLALKYAWGEASFIAWDALP